MARKIVTRRPRIFHGGKPGRKCPSRIVLPWKPCPICKEPFPPRQVYQRYCSIKCRDKAKMLKIRIREPKIERKSTQKKPFGILKCPVCKNEFTSTRSGKKYCSHRCFRLRLQRNWKNENRGKGLCYSCTQPPLKGTSSYCREHWLYQAAWRSGLRGKDRWMELEDLLSKQKYKCAYTGRTLVLGENASVDHKKPRSLFPDLAGDIDNLEWVDLEVNRAKRMLSRDQFIALCRLVAERADQNRDHQQHQVAPGTSRAQM